MYSRLISMFIKWLRLDTKTQIPTSIKKVGILIRILSIVQIQKDSELSLSGFQNQYFGKLPSVSIV